MEWTSGFLETMNLLSAHTSEMYCTYFLCTEFHTNPNWYYGLNIAVYLKWSFIFVWISKQVIYNDDLGALNTIYYFKYVGHIRSQLGDLRNFPFRKSNSTLCLVCASFYDCTIKVSIPFFCSYQLNQYKKHGNKCKISLIVNCWKAPYIIGQFLCEVNVNEQWSGTGTIKVHTQPIKWEKGTFGDGIKHNKCGEPGEHICANKVATKQTPNIPTKYHARMHTTMTNSYNP